MKSVVVAHCLVIMARTAACLMGKKAQPVYEDAKCTNDNKIALLNLQGVWNVFPCPDEHKCVKEGDMIRCMKDDTQNSQNAPRVKIHTVTVTLPSSDYATKTPSIAPTSRPSDGSSQSANASAPSAQMNEPQKKDLLKDLTDPGLPGQMHIKPNRKGSNQPGNQMNNSSGSQMNNQMSNQPAN
ncbi:hypothetical protein NEMIN01_2272, partial [Nematocida minor]|uniref:uncharacterized protein n=1 Tax=Nematocida minor TaxID=1912983 RepID=UPI002220DF20